MSLTHGVCAAEGSGVSVRQTGVPTQLELQQVDLNFAVLHVEAVLHHLPGGSHEPRVKSHDSGDAYSIIHNYYNIIYIHVLSRGDKPSFKGC